MAGGTWLTQNKYLPGVYINFTSVPKPLGVASERGIGTFADNLSWGPEGEVTTIYNGDDTYNKLGYSLNDPQMLNIREYFKGTDVTPQPRMLYLWRLESSGATATAVIDTLTVTAKYKGVRGNDISIVISNDVDNPSRFIVTTIVDGAVQDRQTAATVGELVNNNWVSFTGNAADVLTANVGTTLAGGTDGVVTNNAHVSYISAIEPYLFNTIAYLGNDPTICGMYTAFAKRMRSESGRYFECVIAQYPQADTEAVISINNSVVLDSGDVLTPMNCAAWMAGASAGANNNQSLTNAAYPGAADASPKLKNYEIEAAIKDGEIVFFEEYGSVKVVRDINTLTTFTPSKGQSFSKNRVVRVLDSIANDTYRIYSTYYVGKVDNNDTGRSLLKQEIVKYIKDLQGNDAVQNFTSDDVTVLPGDEVDSVVIKVRIQPVDSVEKIYMDITLA